MFESEHAIIDYLQRWLTERNITTVRVAHERSLLEQLPAAQKPFSLVANRSSLVARLPGSGAGRSLIFNAHVDVVPAGDPKGWSHPPFEGALDPAVRAIFGRGAMDDKAGVAVALGLIDLVQAVGEPLTGDLVFQFVLEDETTGNGSLLCLQAGHVADAAIIIDGTRPDRAINEHAGQVQFGLVLEGRAASVSVSHLGVNAIEQLGALLLHLRNVTHELNRSRAAPWTRFPSPFQLITQSLHGDAGALTVPDRATATCYATFVPPYTLSRFRGLIEQEVAAFESAHELPTRPVVDWSGFATEPVRADAEPLAHALRASAARVTSGDIEVGPSTGTSDLRHFVQAGIPCLLYGPGRGFNPHRPDEHFFVDDLVPMVRGFFELVYMWGSPKAT